MPRWTWRGVLAATALTAAVTALTTAVAAPSARAAPERAPEEVVLERSDCAGRELTGEVAAGPDGVLRGFVACSDYEESDVVYYVERRGDGTWQAERTPYKERENPNWNERLLVAGVAADATGTYLIFEEEADVPMASLWAAKRTADGTYGTPVEIVDNGPYILAVRPLDVVARDGRWWAAFEEVARGGASDLQVFRGDGTTARRLTGFDGQYGAAYPNGAGLAFDGDELVLAYGGRVWSEDVATDGVWLTGSTDGGETWSALTLVDGAEPTPSGGVHWRVAGMNVLSGTTHVLWYLGDEEAVYETRRRDGEIGTTPIDQRATTDTITAAEFLPGGRIVTVVAGDAGYSLRQRVGERWESTPLPAEPLQLTSAGDTPLLVMGDEAAGRVTLQPPPAT